MKALVLTCCALLFAHPACPQSPDMEHHPFAIGEINYFGYGDLPLQMIRAAVPWHTGDTLTLATFSRKPVEDAIQSAIGKPPTDVNVTCCDPSGHLELYIGLPGSTSHTVPTSPAPSANTHLDPRAMALYEQGEPLLMQAVARGAAGEDDSQGYMLSNDPALKAVNLAMRSYAIGRESELKKVLQTAKDPKDRRAAAALLGYVRSSNTQAEALSQAINDPDDEVRNNAVRALYVLSAATATDRPKIDVEPLIHLLYSGSWTDRNKASLLLLRMTDARNPEVLDSLRKEALAPLIEGGSWVDVPGHSTPFLLILGRIGGIPDQKLQDLIKSGNKDAIISAATTANNHARH
jgi:hypothetical protein